MHRPMLGPKGIRLLLAAVDALEAAVALMEDREQVEDLIADTSCVHCSHLYATG